MKNLFKNNWEFILVLGVITFFIMSIGALIFDVFTAKEKQTVGVVCKKVFTPSCESIEMEKKFSHFDFNYDAVYIYTPKRIFHNNKFEVFYKCEGELFSIETDKERFGSIKEGSMITCSIRVGSISGIKYKKGI